MTFDALLGGEKPLGIGADLVSISRIEGVFQRSGERFIQRVLRPEEIELFQLSAKPLYFLAKRFAAKEAASKALGCGIGKVSWQDFLVSNDELGAPQLHCFGEAKKRMQNLGAHKAFISLSDEREHALAFVVLSTN